MSLKIVFAGTPEFAMKILAKLLNTSHSILAVYTQPDRPSGRGQKITESPVKQLAIKYNIPVYQPLNFKNLTAVSFLNSLDPDIMVVAAYGLILPKNVLSIPKYGCINVHASLLPRWRGAAPIQHAILAGDSTTGITIMQMDEGLDTGDIISTHPISISEQDTAEMLHDKLAELGANALVEALNKIEKQDIQPIKQDKEQATYAHKIQKVDARIDWKKSAIEIQRFIRAFNPWPIAYTFLEGQLLRIWKAAAVKNNATQNSSTTGIITDVQKDAIEIQTIDGCLRILEIQFPGGKPISIKDALHSTKGAVFKMGARFENA